MLKKIFGIVLFLAAFALTSQAQEKKQKTEKHKAKKEWKKSGRQELNLSPQQQNEIRSINMQFKDQVKAVRDNKSLTEAQRKEEIKSLHATRQEKVKAILTPEQKQKMAQHKRPRKKQHNRDTTIK